MNSIKSDPGGSKHLAVINGGNKRFQGAEGPQSWGSPCMTHMPSADWPLCY